MFYTHEEFDLCDLLPNKTISTEFVNYVIENKLIKFYISEYEYFNYRLITN